MNIETGQFLFFDELLNVYVTRTLQSKTGPRGPVFGKVECTNLFCEKIWTFVLCKVLSSVLMCLSFIHCIRSGCLCLNPLVVDYVRFLF